MKATQVSVSGVLKGLRRRPMALLALFTCASVSLQLTDSNAAAPILYSGISA